MKFSVAGSRFLSGGLQRGISVRHEHSCLNVLEKANDCGGWLDIPLDNQGLREAAETAERLADYPVESIYSSDVRFAPKRYAGTHALSGHHHQRITPVESRRVCNERVMDIFLNLLISIRLVNPQRRVLLSVLRTLLAPPD